MGHDGDDDLDLVSKLSGKEQFALARTVMWVDAWRRVIERYGPSAGVLLLATAFFASPQSKDDFFRAVMFA
ncbi:MAG TPA: hypothetical protein VJU61_05705, partial [Polyangiaceae bacterium]|nr:hypothetical protein [Polyangiaceae bacterium]